MVNDNTVNKYFQSKKTLQYNGELIYFNKPLIMGILNVTPDSFYDGGRFSKPITAVEHACNMISQGASIIDVGACSTRPGAVLPSLSEELKRLHPVVSKIKQKFPDIILSIDTFRSEVVKSMIESYGDCIVNDISAGSLDDNMFETVAKLRVPYILMHMQGTPQTMQNNPSYANVTKDVIRFLSEKIRQLHSLGVCDVIVDPGFGFGKSIDHNYELFNHLDAFRFFELPLLVGISRKSMIYKFLETSAEQSLPGTIVLNTLALNAGANILRVHDVQEASDAIKIFEKVKEYSI